MKRFRRFSHILAKSSSFQITVNLDSIFFGGQAPQQLAIGARAPQQPRLAAVRLSDAVPELSERSESSSDDHTPHRNGMASAASTHLNRKGYKYIS